MKTRKTPLNPKKTLKTTPNQINKKQGGIATTPPTG
jgi:hypothetical protein